MGDSVPPAMLCPLLRFLEDGHCYSTQKHAVTMSSKRFLANYRFIQRYASASLRDPKHSNF